MAAQAGYGQRYRASEYGGLEIILLRSAKMPIFFPICDSFASVCKSCFGCYSISQIEGQVLYL